MKKVLRYSLILCLLLGAKAHAQDRVVSGKVTAADDKLPIPGVTVKAVGASAATQTNADGLFTLPIPEGVTQLQFSFLGYATRGAFSVIVEFDPITGNPVAVTNKAGQPAANTRYGQLDASGVNTYDPVSKTITIKYNMCQPSVIPAPPSIRTTWDEVWKFKKDRE